MRYVLLLLFGIFSFCLFAKDTETVTVTGEYSLVSKESDISIKQACANALEDAKTKAIEKVCGVRVSVWDRLETSSSTDNFSSMSIISSDGEIVDYEVLKEWNESSSTRGCEHVFFCEIKAKVKKGVQPDPNFTAVIDGLKHSYRENELMKFSIKSQKDCYLHIFLFEDYEHGYKIYPGTRDKIEQFSKNVKFEFPRANNVKYRLTKKANVEKETNRLIFVFTKKELNFNEETTSVKDIDLWIAKIPAEEKFIYCSIFNVF